MKSKLKKINDNIFNIVFRADNIRDKIRPYFKILIDFLFENNIQYIIDGGILLQAARDRDELIWDDDYDLYFVIEEFEKLNNILETKPLFEYDGSKFHFKLITINRGVMTINAKFTCKKKPITVSDIFFEGDASGWSKPDRKDIFPIRRIDFGSLKVNVMNYPVNYLNTIYGAEWPNTYYFTNKFNTARGFSIMNKSKYNKFTSEEYKLFKKAYLKQKQLYIANNTTSSPDPVSMQSMNNKHVRFNLASNTYHEQHHEEKENIILEIYNI